MSSRFTSVREAATGNSVDPFDSSASLPGGLPLSTDVLYRLLVEGSTAHAIFSLSISGTISSWNRGAENVFGYSKAEIADRDFGLLFTAEDRRAGEPKKELVDALAAGRSQNERWHRRKDGSLFRGTNSVEPLLDECGKAIGFVKIVHDTTERFEAAEALRRSEVRFRTLVESLQGYALVALSDDGTITNWNSGATVLFGYDAAEIVGAHVSRLYFDGDVRAGVPLRQLAAAREHAQCIDERWRPRKGGARMFCSGRIVRSVVERSTSPGFILIAHDDSERKRAENELERQAMSDILTGLPNRNSFLQHLECAIARAVRHDQQYAVCFLDVDDFKSVNDSLGHFVADALLRAASARIAATLRSEDVVARFGGDEFAILLNNVRDVGEVTVAVDRVRASTREPFHIEGHDTYVSFSIGIAMSDPAYAQAEQILRNADIAMYEAKAGGRSNVRLFDASMHERTVAQHRRKNELRRALERDELRVHYQPIVCISSGETLGFEALVRWSHPSEGVLVPGDFLDAAIAIGEIAEIDRRVLRIACHDLASRRRSHPERALVLSVNVSAEQFLKPDFSAFVLATLEETEFPPDSLKMEITERSLMSASPSLMHEISAMRDLGIEFYIDDFGTGYSSLSYLSIFPVSAVKIDRSFIASSERSERDSKIVATIVQLANALDVKTIAEGIESRVQLARMNDLGCDYGQGYLFGKPLEWSAAIRALDADGPTAGVTAALA